MAHTEITNDLPLEAGLLQLNDQEGVPIAVVVIKATYTIQYDSLVLAEQQLPIFQCGIPNGEPGKSSYRYEPECAYFKPATDVVLIANCVAPSGAATYVDVEFSVGPLQKRALVIGDRFWYRSFLGTGVMRPEPFREMPLVYERSFGGWDRSHSSSDRHTYECRNPVGCGFQKTFLPDQDLAPLPNIEDPYDLVSEMGRGPAPVGFGFVSPDWQPRASYAGTYDDVWSATRMPALPLDFDTRFLNAASPGLVADGYLVGNERVAVTNCTDNGFISFKLPGIPPPSCLFRLARSKRTKAVTRLDTVVVNTVDRVVTMTWRCHVHIPLGPEQLQSVRIY